MIWRQCFVLKPVFKTLGCLTLAAATSGALPVCAQSLLDTLPKSADSEPAKVDTEQTLAIRAFEMAIGQLESEGGAYAAGIAEQVLGLAQLLQQQDRHLEAADWLKRGIHVARISGGLYSREQIPLLRAQIKSLVALGEYAAVDERQRYLYRVERQVLGEGLASANALMRQGEWQRDAFLLGIDEAEAAPQRLLIMWDVYRLALNQLIGVYGSNKPALEPALEGMLTSQYLIAGFRGYQQGFTSRSDELRLTAYTSEAYKRGKSVLRALMELHAANNGDDATARARDLQRLGDWSWWFGNRREAMQPYSEAWDLAMTTDPSGDLVAELFATPAPLPDVEGIASVPEPTPRDSGELVLSFGVSSSGRVTDLERLRAPDVEDSDPIDKLERLVRGIRFRPQIVDGEAVATEGMVWSFDAEDWQTLE
jgi:hypothetical protein